MTVPQTTLSTLYRADGSATFVHGGYSVIAAVNGPIEVQRRDELPEEAAIEVNIRPATGVGSASDPVILFLHLNDALISSQARKSATSNHSSTAHCAASS